MVIIVKPVNAQLIKDKDTFGKSVIILLKLRILIVSVSSVQKSNEPKPIVEEENNHNGMILFNSTLKIA